MEIKQKYSNYTLIYKNQSLVFNEYGCFIGNWKHINITFNEMCDLEFITQTLVLRPERFKNKSIEQIQEYATSMGYNLTEIMAQAVIKFVNKV